MNNDLISRCALKEGIACHKQWTDQEYETDRQWALGYNAGIDRALFSITYARAVDAEPVKHGIWEETPNVWECSECHKWLMVTQRTAGMNYCTHCGARMDGRANDENA